MKAAIYRRYGPPDVIQIEDVEKPVPKANELLIKVRAAFVNPYDWHFMRGEPYPLRLALGLGNPKDTRLGVDAAGQVESVGANVTRFEPGDAVFGACKGAFAQYACAPESKLALKPDNVSFEQAASVPIAGLTALQGLRDKGRLQSEQRVLINGAAGGVGTFAVQIAKSFGATVTAVCSTKNLEMVRSLGADHAIDYTQEDFTKGERRHDLILDCIANHSLGAFRRVLNPTGTYLMVGGPASPWMPGFAVRLLKASILSRFLSQKMVFVGANLNQQDLAILSDLMTSAKITPVIDRRYPLSEIAEAIRYLELGHGRGKVIITLD